MKVRLLEDVISVFKGRVYCRKGGEVSVIAEYGEVLIVEASSGDRFAVKKDKTTTA